MKRAVIVTGGLVVLGALCCMDRLGAQQPQYQQVAAQAPPALRTHIAIINLTYVIKHYKRYQTFQEEMKTAFKPYQDKDTELKKRGEPMAKELKDLQAVQPNPQNNAKKADLEWKLKGLQREIEDNNAQAKIALGNRSDEQMLILYKDVVDAAQRYAAAHDFDLVLHYNDATTETDYWGPMNIARKLQSGALMPLYASPGMDISKEVVAALNYSMPSGTPAAAAPQGAPPAGGQQ